MNRSSVPAADSRPKWFRGVGAPGHAAPPVAGPTTARMRWARRSRCYRTTDVRSCWCNGHTNRSQGGGCCRAGFVEYGEYAADSAVREAEEETGLQVELTGLRGLYSGLTIHVTWRTWWCTTHKWSVGSRRPATTRQRWRSFPRTRFQRRSPSRDSGRRFGTGSDRWSKSSAPDRPGGAHSSRQCAPGVEWRIHPRFRAQETRHRAGKPIDGARGEEQGAGLA